MLLKAGRRWLRVLGIVYRALVLFVVVATGNHFLVDAAAGTAAAAVGGALAYVALHAAGRIRRNAKR